MLISDTIYHRVICSRLAYSKKLEATVQRVCSTVQPIKQDCRKDRIQDLSNNVYSYIDGKFSEVALSVTNYSSLRMRQLTCFQEIIIIIIIIIIFFNVKLTIPTHYKR